MAPLLELTNLQVRYNRAIEAVRDVSLKIEEGAMVALLGSNGAGKSTVLKAISRVLDQEDGEIVAGSVVLAGENTGNWSAAAMVGGGVVQVPEGRALFPPLTVEENLLMGAYTRPRRELGESIAEIYALFPRLKERRSQVSGYLSGGEQQMVALGRALMAKPRLLMLDEPSLGLAPQIVELIFSCIETLNKQRRLTVLLVEQNAEIALSIANYGYIMENGRIVLDGTPARLKANSDVQEFYLGLGAAGSRRSMRDVKHYKRRKRWLS